MRKSKVGPRGAMPRPDPCSTRGPTFPLVRQKVSGRRARGLGDDRLSGAQPAPDGEGPRLPKQTGTLLASRWPRGRNQRRRRDGPCPRGGPARYRPGDGGAGFDRLGSWHGIRALGRRYARVVVAAGATGSSPGRQRPGASLASRARRPCRSSGPPRVGTTADTRTRPTRPTGHVFSVRPPTGLRHPATGPTEGPACRSRRGRSRPGRVSAGSYATPRAGETRVSTSDAGFADLR
jgi:hypothetical protein